MQGLVRASVLKRYARLLSLPLCKLCRAFRFSRIKVKVYSLKRSFSIAHSRNRIKILFLPQLPLHDQTQRNHSSSLGPQVRTMIKRHQQYDALEAKVRTLEGENASLQRKLKRLHEAGADAGSPAADLQKPWTKPDSKPEEVPGRAAEDDNSREDVPIANRKLGKTNSMDVDKPKAGGASEGDKTDGGGGSGGGGPSMRPADLEALVNRARAGLAGGKDEERLKELLKTAERAGELEQALAEQKHRADK